MKLLFLTNFFPPVARGGYEEWAAEVAHALQVRGHEVLVLTSRHAIETIESAEPPWIDRSLHLEMEIESPGNATRFFTTRKRREQANLMRLRRTIFNARPDAVVVWGMWNLPRSLPAFAESLLPGRVVYYIGDYWPSLPTQHRNFWESPSRSHKAEFVKALLRPLARRMLAREKRPALQLNHTLFPTEFMRREFTSKGFTPRHSAVVTGAVELTPYLAIAREQNLKDEKDKREQKALCSLLYVGRLMPEKGVHIALLALHELVHKRGQTHLHLTIVGSGEREYEHELRALVLEKQLGSYVTFTGVQPKAEMVSYYRAAEIFLFPSIWPEPFGRVLVEAMAAEVAVVGTSTGGAVEILEHGVNGLQCRVDDPIALANGIEALLENPSYRRELARAARQMARETFHIKQMVSGIERYVQQVVDSHVDSSRARDQDSSTEDVLHLVSPFRDSELEEMGQSGMNSTAIEQRETENLSSSTVCRKHTESAVSSS